MSIGQRAWGAVRWGASTTVAIVGGVLSAFWSALAPWLRVRRPAPITNQPSPADSDKAACCQMDLTAHRKNPWIKPCHCKFNTVLYVNIAPKYKSYKDSFEEAERQVHLTVRKGQSSATRSPESSRASRSPPPPAPTTTVSTASVSPGSKGGRDSRGQALALRQGALVARHKTPEPKHLKATNL